MGLEREFRVSAQTPLQLYRPKLSSPVSSGCTRGSTAKRQFHRSRGADFGVPRVSPTLRTTGVSRRLGRLGTVFHLLGLKWPLPRPVFFILGLILFFLLGAAAAGRAPVHCVTIFHRVTAEFWQLLQNGKMMHPDFEKTGV